MLILVGVTVNVAMDGGLFEKSQDAKAKTDKNSEKEQLISAAVGALEEGANFSIQAMTLPEGATWITEKDGEAINQPYMNGNWVKTSKGNQFYIDNKGNVLDEEPSTEDPVTNIEDTIEGTYIIGGIEGDNYVTLNSNGTVSLVYTSDVDEIYNGTYTYDSNEKNGEITLQSNDGSEVHEFIYDIITDENTGNIINKIIVMDEELYTINGAIGLMPLTGYTYSDGNGNTIQFYEEIRHEITIGFADGYPIIEDYYACYNNIFYIEGRSGDYILSNDNNTLTRAATSGSSGTPEIVFTRQQ